MHERANIVLNTADRAKLERVIANRNSPQKHVKHVWRAKIVLLTADGHGTVEINAADRQGQDSYLAVARAIWCRRCRGTVARQDAALAHSALGFRNCRARGGAHLGRPPA